MKTGQLPDGVSAPELLKLWDGRLALTGGTTGDKSYSKQVVLEKKLSFTTLNPMSNPRGVHGMAQWSADRLSQKMTSPTRH